MTSHTEVRRAGDLQLHTIHGRQQPMWDATVQRLPLHHILQSWAWGEFKSRWDWTPTRLMWRRGGRPVAAAHLLRRALPGIPVSIAYVSKGPVFDPDDPALVDRVLHDIEEEARRQRCLFVKIDPDVPAEHHVVVSLLQNRGWRSSPEQIQFRNTAILDVTPDEETLLMAMHQKTRYNVRYAGRKGVEVTAGTPDDLPLFYDMYYETAQRNDFLIRPRAYYLDLWHDFLQRDLAHLQIAWLDDEPLAGQILFKYGTTVWYFYGASRDVHRNTMPTYRLQWEAIRWAKSVGATRYDMWGAPDELAEDDPLWGVWRFKRGFNPEFREQIGAWDYPVTALGYWFLMRAIPRIRRWWRQQMS